MPLVAVLERSPVVAVPAGQVAQAPPHTTMVEPVERIHTLAVRAVAALGDQMPRVRWVALTIRLAQVEVVAEEQAMEVL